MDEDNFMEWQKKDSIIKFDPKVVQAIEGHGGHLKCQSDMTLFYEGHVPIVVYLLKSGRINVGQGKRKLFQLSPGEILGLNEFYQKCPSLFWAQVQEGSELIYIDRSTLDELITDGPKKVQEVLNTALDD